MFYILENEKIVLCDEDKQRLENTILFMPQYQGLEVIETDKNIVEFNDVFYFEDDEEYISLVNQKEKERILTLSMSKSDFFDGTIKAFGADQDDLLPAIQGILDMLPLQDVEKKVALNNYKNAKDFYRKHTLFTLLSDTDIVLTPELTIHITGEQWDKFFDETDKKNPEAYKELLPTPIIEDEIVSDVEPIEPEVETPTIEEEIEETQGE